MPNSFAKRQAEKRKPPSFYVFGVTWSGIEPRPPAPRADALTTMLRAGGGIRRGLLYLKMKQLEVIINIILFAYWEPR